MKIQLLIAGIVSAGLLIGCKSTQPGTSEVRDGSLSYGTSHPYGYFGAYFTATDSGQLAKYICPKEKNKEVRTEFPESLRNWALRTCFLIGSVSADQAKNNVKRLLLECKDRAIKNSLPVDAERCELAIPYVDEVVDSLINTEITVDYERFRQKGEWTNRGRALKYIDSLFDELPDPRVAKWSFEDKNYALHIHPKPYNQIATTCESGYRPLRTSDIGNSHTNKNEESNRLIKIRSKLDEEAKTTEGWLYFGIAWGEKLWLIDDENGGANCFSRHGWYRNIGIDFACRVLCIAN